MAVLLLTRSTLLLSTQVSTALVCGLLGAVVTSIIVIAAVAAVAAKYNPIVKHAKPSSEI